MAIVGLLTPYSSQVAADTLLINNATWSDFDDDGKYDALQLARVYIDTHYYCPDIDQDDDVPSDIPTYLQTANGMLAGEQSGGDIFTAAERNRPANGLISTEAKATPVGVKKTYDPNVSSEWKDPFPIVTAIMKANYCKLLIGSISRTTVRG